MSKEANYQKNDRVEFKDTESVFHIGYVKKAWLEHRGIFRKPEWMYDICEYIKGAAIRKVYTVPESNIFGTVEKTLKDKTLKEFKGDKSYNDFGELKELINE